MKNYLNPFVTSDYVSKEYFCNREEEINQLIAEIKKGNNLALVSTRRMGKTGLIKHCFNAEEIRENCRTFFVDYLLFCVSCTENFI